MDIAMVNGNDEILDILKSAEGYSNLTATLPRKPLLEAIKSDDSDTLRKRIATESRENLNTVSAFIGTPLSMACKHARSDVVLMLLHAGADPNIYDRFGRTPLFNAIVAGSLSCVQALASNGADINDDLPIRPWEHSVKRNRKEIALYLIENGAYIRHNSPSLQTALHIAVEKDNLTAVRRLVDAGASIHLKDKGEGYAAINLARKYNATKTLDYFSQLPVVSSSHEIENEEVDEVAHKVEKVEDAQNNSHESSIPLKGDTAAGTAGRATDQILRAKVHLPIQFSLLGFLLCIGFLMALYPYILFKK
jgi:ankyrin repeat protein